MQSSKETTNRVLTRAYESSSVVGYQKKLRSNSNNSLEVEKKTNYLLDGLVCKVVKQLCKDA